MFLLQESGYTVSAKELDDSTDFLANLAWFGVSIFLHWIWSTGFGHRWSLSIG